MKTWTATMDCGWRWTVRARTEEQARERVARQDLEVFGRIRTPVELVAR